MCVFFLKKIEFFRNIPPPQMPPFTHIEDKFKKHPNFLIFIQRRIKKWLKMLHNSPKIYYNKQSIHYKSKCVKASSEQ